MAVSDRDRQRMGRLARALASAETDAVADAGTLADAVAWADDWRWQAGLPPLAEAEDPPEEELYRRARALGLRRSSR